MNLPINPHERKCIASEEQVDRKERSNFQLFPELRVFSVKKDMILSHCVDKTKKGEDNTCYTEPNF